MGESEAETTSSDNSVNEDEDEDEDEEGGGGDNDSAISEYEKQRLERIEENRARLKALGLPHLASSFLASPDTPPSKSKKRNISINNRNRRRKGTEDEEYRPSPDEEEDSRGERENPSSSSEEEEVDVGNSCSRRRRKGKNKSTSQAAKARKKLHGKERARGSEEIDDDTALQQAIALSLGGATEQTGSLEASQNCGTNGASSNSHAKKDSLNIKETAGRKNSRQMNKSRPQLIEDEVVALFFSFDGNGHITVRDLRRMVIAHDFSWTDVEMENMIHCFDGDRDGMLSVEDFRSIISSLNMLQESRKC